MTLRLVLAGRAAVLAAGAAVLAAGFGASAEPAQAAAPPAVNVQSCTGSSFCLATGSQPGKHGSVPVIEEWNGKAWRIIPNPTGYQGQITCGGPSFCLAVTSRLQKPALEVLWNGKAWKRFSPQPPDLDVACISPTFCAASGGDSGGDGVAWNGKTWLGMPIDNGGGCGGAWCSTQSFGCASATICWSSGEYCGDDDCDDGTFFWNDVWNGTAFDPGPDLSGVGDNQACTGQAFCLDLDPPQATITNNLGVTWQSASRNLATACRHVASCALPSRPACGSPHSCLALPSQDPSASLVWNGTRWGVIRLALISGQLPRLNLLACGSPRSCMATGTYQLGPRGAVRPVAEHWNGKAWSITRIATR